MLDTMTSIEPDDEEDDDAPLPMSPRLHSFI